MEASEYTPLMVGDRPRTDWKKMGIKAAAHRVADMTKEKFNALVHSVRLARRASGIMASAPILHSHARKIMAPTPAPQNIPMTTGELQW